MEYNIFILTSISTNTYLIYYVIPNYCSLYVIILAIMGFLFLYTIKINNIVI